MNGRYSVEPPGIRRRSAAGETLMAWQVIEGVATSGQHIYIRFLGTGWIIPNRCFATEDDRSAFVEAIERQRTAA